MHRLLPLLAVLGCGPVPQLTAPVTVRLPGAPSTDLLRLSADIADGGALGLADGGDFWLAADGVSRQVDTGATVEWVAAERQVDGSLDVLAASGCHDTFVVGDAGVTVTVNIGFDGCTYEYE